MDNISLDFKWFAENVLQIQTKTDGLKPFKLRKIQLKYIDHLNTEFKNGIIRSIVLKPRQSGFSTLIAGINTYKMFTGYDQRGIMLADKLGRASEVFTIYDNFRKNAPEYALPKKNKKDIINTQQLYFESRRSGFKRESQNDPNAGRAGTRLWGHLSEFAFYSNADAIDEGIQNSIPLAPGTRIFKESTAFGVSGIGRSYYEQWEAACRGDSIYKPFFVPWFDVEDYALLPERNFVLNQQEKELMRICPVITKENLAWRRMKLKEYASSSEQIFTPEDRFCQDFPSFPEEAFLSSGRPVFEQNQIKKHINALITNPPKILPVTITKPTLQNFRDLLRVYFMPEKNEKYIIGADVSEGLAIGDASSAFIMTKDCKQVARFHGKIDPDLFGKVLVELAITYNNALIVPEMNSIGFATLSAIKNQGYLRVYQRDVIDEIGLVETKKLGWRTTASSKQTMLARLIAFYRDSEVTILDVDLLKEMMNLTRESNGNVELNSQDRIVAICLALMGIEQMYEDAEVYNPNIKIKLQLEKKDLYLEKQHSNTKW